MSHATDLPAPQLGLSPQEAAAQFEALQQKLVPLWKSIQAMNQDEQTIVIVPSMNIDTEFTSSELQAYEERFLFLLLLLRQPRARVIYVTSQQINPAIIDYYLDLLPGVIASHARKRLFTVAPLDASSRPLSLKLLERPALIAHLRALIPNPDRAHLVPYNTTQLERDLALALGIPMYGADPKYFPLGTKSGCRRIFAEEGVAHPLGVENLTSAQAVIDAILGMRRQKPGIRQVLIKLNEGVSGEGNALVKLEGLPEPGGAGEAEAVAARLKEMQFELQGQDYANYTRKLTERGGVVEERIMGADFRSPSVQLRATPLGKVEILSTHDQVLGGPSGQSYIGCRFPANTEYATLITREAAKVGARLAKEGVLGRFALDFVTVRNEAGAWEVYAIEINLRKGGTTHPFLTLQFLTDGKYDPETGIFTTPRGEQKFFVASDHEGSPSFRVFTPDDLFDIVARHNLHFDMARQKGVVLHMMAAIGTHGSLGLTAVGDTHAEAASLYKKAVEVFHAEADAALKR